MQNLHVRTKVYTLFSHKGYTPHDRLLSLGVSLANGNGLLHSDFLPVLSNIHDHYMNSIHHHYMKPESTPEECYS